MRTAAVHTTVGALALTLTASGTAGASPAEDPPGAFARATARTAAQPPPQTAAQMIGVMSAAREAAARGIDWKKCPKADHMPRFVRCGTVSVPVDYARPHGERIPLAVSRARATGPKGDRLGPLVYNPGGPGGSGMNFPLYGKLVGGLWKRLNARYDFVGYAPRGVGRSAPLSCQDPERFLTSPNSSPSRPTSAFKREMNTRAAAYAKGCAKAQPNKLRHYTTPNNARDLDVLRAALGEGDLNFLGVSYGTYIGSVYATLFPDHVGRLVLDSIVDPSPDTIWYRANLAQNRAFQARWEEWKKWTAQHHASYGLGRTPRQVQSAFDRLRTAVDRRPAGGVVGSKELVAAFLSTGYADSAWPSRARALSRSVQGDTKPLVKIAAPDLAKAKEEENGNAVYNAVECADAPWPRDWATWDRDNTASAAVAPFNTWDNAWMNLPCAHWRTPSSRPLHVGAAPGRIPPVLLLAATRDAATPYQGALETRRRLPGSSLVTEKGSGTHGVAGGNKCADAHVERYLLKGRTPGANVECAARPAPEPRVRPSARTKAAELAKPAR